MAKKLAIVILLAAAVMISVAGCRNYGYRPTFAGGPHLDRLPEWTFPLYTSHKPVPYEELKEVYPPQLNISSK